MFLTRGFIFRKTVVYSTKMTAYTDACKTNCTMPVCKRRAQVKVGLINLCKGLFSLNARIYYKLKSGT
jgi:hypothetical protein